MPLAAHDTLSLLQIDELGRGVASLLAYRPGQAQAKEAKTFAEYALGPTPRPAASLKCEAEKCNQRPQLFKQNSIDSGALAYIGSQVFFSGSSAGKPP